MKAIILSAGQGRRLLPLTRTLPKCLLPVQGGRTLLEVQLRALAQCGIQRASVMVGFGAEQVEQAMAARRGPEIRVTTRYNPFYATTDNLITTWLACAEMNEDFLLLNGDTLFDARILERLLSRSRAPGSIVVNHKPAYDDDDMKVSIGPDGCLRAIGKKLDGTPDAEAIGMSLFQGPGVLAFRNALEDAVRTTEALRKWYTSVLDDLAHQIPVHTVSTEGHWWGEVDARPDLDAARGHFESRRGERRGPHSRPSASA